MTGGFPILGSLANATAIHDDANNPTQLTATVSNNTKSAWKQLVASSGSDAAAIIIRSVYGNTAALTYSVDIGVGAGGSEQIIVPDLFLSTHNATAYSGVDLLLPLQIPAGTRIAARYQSSSSVGTMFIGLTLLDGGFTQSGASGVDSMGFTAASTAGVSVTPGASSKGSYAQIIASTASDYAGFFLELDVTASTASDTVIDIAVGGAGSEKIILPNHYAILSNLHRLTTVVSSFFPIFIPAGSRVAARASADSASAFGLVMHGVRQ